MGLLRHWDYVVILWMIYAQAEEVMDMITAFGAHIRVTETGSFPAIVPKCDVSQPSVTRQIERLEQHFEVFRFTTPPAVLA
jgi:hypothetical protein